MVIGTFVTISLGISLHSGKAIIAACADCLSLMDAPANDDECGIDSSPQLGVGNSRAYNMLVVGLVRANPACAAKPLRP